METLEELTAEYLWAAVRQLKEWDIPKDAFKDAKIRPETGRIPHPVPISTGGWRNMRGADTPMFAGR